MSFPLKVVLFAVVALVLALSARALYVNMTGAEPLDVADPAVHIRVAADQLPAGLLLRSDDLAIQSLPRSKVPQGAILENSQAATTLTGVMLRRAVAAGAPILERDIIRPNAPGFLSAVLKPDMRAVSLAVDNVSGNAGLIQPGDYVDVILVQQAGNRGADFGFPDTQAQARSVVSETVVQKARVIAVGSEFIQSTQDDSARRDTNRTAARTVTLEVRPRAAEAIAVASRLGSITLALRSFAITDRSIDQDDAGVTWAGEANDTGPLWAGDVSRAIAEATQRKEGRVPVDSDSTVPAYAPAPVARQITIYRGSEQSTQSLGATTP